MDNLSEIVARREQFDDLVQHYKTTYKKKFKDILQDPELSKEFFSNPQVQNYLSRSSSAVQFSPEGYPEHLSAYELKIYEYYPNCMPWRNEFINTSVYRGGPEELGLRRIGEFISSRLSNADIEIMQGDDTNQIRFNLLTRHLSNRDKPSPRFVLTPYWKHGLNSLHAMTFLTILHTDTHKPMVMLFINSFKHDAFYQRIKRTITSEINGNNRYLTTQSDAFKMLCAEEFKIHDIDSLPEERSEYQSPNGRKKLILDSAVTSSRSDYVHVPEDSNEYYHLMRGPSGELGLITMRVNPPMLDVSHSLQTHEGNNSSVLYGINFIPALRELLEDTETANQLYELALQIDISQDTTAEKKLIQIIQEDLKPHLPMYYTQSGEVKTFQEIDQYHTKKRWDIRPPIDESTFAYRPNRVQNLFETQKRKHKELFNQFNTTMGHTYQREEPNNLSNKYKTAAQSFFKKIRTDPKQSSHTLTLFKAKCHDLVREGDKVFYQPGSMYIYTAQFFIHVVFLMTLLRILDRHHYDDVNAYFNLQQIVQPEVARQWGQIKIALVGERGLLSELDNALQTSFPRI